MSRLISKLFLAIAFVILFLTLASLRVTIPNDLIDSASLGGDGGGTHDGGGSGGEQLDESLRGASAQEAALASPPPFSVSEEILQGPNRKLSPEEKRKQEEARKKQEEAKKREEEAKKRGEEEMAKRKAAEEEAKKLAEYKKSKIYPGTFNVPADLKHDPKGPKPSEIVLLTASDGKGHNGGIENILGDITPNRQEYANLHGYHYQFFNITRYNIGGAQPVWAKLPAIVEAFNVYPQAKWVWWLDLDAIIMTPSVDLTAHLLAHDVLYEKMRKGFEMSKSGGGMSGVVTRKNPDMQNIDLIVTQDQNGLNAGSFWIRRSEFSRMFMDMWADPFYVRQGWVAQEQDAMFHLIKEHPTVLDHVALVSQRQINAYPVPNVPDMSWEEGDFVVHFAGCWVEGVCNDQWREFMARRTLAADISKAGSAARATTTAKANALPRGV